MLLPLQGDKFASLITQGVALGEERLPFQGVLRNSIRTGRIFSFSYEFVLTLVAGRTHQDASALKFRT